MSYLSRFFEPIMSFGRELHKKKDNIILRRQVDDHIGLVLLWSISFEMKHY